MGYRLFHWASIALLCVPSLAQSAVGQAEMSDDGRLFAEADRRIEEHRKADGAIVVVDSKGRPIKDVEITVQQTRHAFLFGCNIFKFGKFADPHEEATYRDRYRDVFNYATLPFYWPQYEPRRGSPSHVHAEQTARWCRENGIRTKGHPLAWNFSDPKWLPDESEEILQLQLQRIRDCVSRLHGLVDTWDVVNEATHFERDEFKRRSPKLTKMWEETGRIEFIDQCFKMARGANPDGTLLINDYRTDSDFAKVIDDMTEKAGKRPYDVIGLQSHMHGGTWDNAKIWEVCERFRRFDVPLHFTELTILSGETGRKRTAEGGDWPSTEAGERLQAEEVERVYTMLFSHPAVAAITWWDFSDRNAWQRAPAGLIREDLSPKPAYHKLNGLIKGKWWTNLEGTTAADGRFDFRGFLGDFVVRARTRDGRTAEQEVTLTKAGTNRFDLRLN